MKPQPSLCKRRQQREFALVGTRKLQEIRRKYERPELILASGGTNFVQLLTGGKEHVAVGALVGVVGDGERNVTCVYCDDFQLRMPVIGDKIAVIGLAAVQRGVDLKRKRKRAVLFFFSSGSVHGDSPSFGVHLRVYLKIVLFFEKKLQAISSLSAIIIDEKGRQGKSATQTNRIFVVSFARKSTVIFVLNDKAFPYRVISSQPQVETEHNNVV